MKSIYKSVFALLVGLGFISCEGIVDDLNKDPNNATDAPARYVFTGTEIANMAAQEGLASRLAIVWTGYGKGTFQQLGTWYLYQITASNFDDDWNLFFAGVNKNALIAIEKAEALGNRKMAGIAKIVQVNGMATATELWGDIPYSEAGNTAEFPNPKFETQAELYPKLLARLDEAIADLESGIGIVTTEDIYLGGDATKWKQVAYTLKARLLTDTKQYDAALTAATTGVSTFANSLYSLHGTTASVNENANYSFLTNIRAGSITGEDSYLTFLLNPANAKYRGNAKTIETARFKFYYLENGVNAPGVIEPNTSTTTTARGFFARDASFPLVTYQENVLTMAEAALRSGKGFDVALGYLNNYRAFLNGGGYLHATYKVAGTYKYEAYTADDFATGGMENKDGITADQALLREILEERYVTFYGQHIGWDDERRTRSESVGIKITPSNGTQLPGRFIYSQNELNSNTSSPKVAPGLFELTSIYK
ncbi:SusD/RagB family nutrient-binding outer membrane lipoprotein [Dyadobacter subterraneus]|uniref:SusD/RagB family nutrient-binding outer membrane lipoprotein n=1 Tax=Dyadobacter subterraneus TaxID=2773304 RepID=A0ABR9WBN1_9BACT|nr:SusD/RagB family nutrient-binding outer membrane lipoprotein [Dyadobacter subterraneus]MBE9462828.1 SusD/RagB family nutrient-binding outer membrane lipoprotein [Dyadobacter subterraneus]